MKPSTGCSGITKRDCTRHCITSVRCSSNKTRRLARKHPQVERTGNRNRPWKSRKAKTAFQLSHSHDDYEVHSVMGYGFQGQTQYSLFPLTPQPFTITLHT